MWISEGPPIPNVSHNTNQRTPAMNNATLSVVTDRTIHNNRPDRVTSDKSIKEAYLIEIRNIHKYRGAVKSLARPE